MQLTSLAALTETEAIVQYKATGKAKNKPAIEALKNGGGHTGEGNQIETFTIISITTMYKKLMLTALLKFGMISV